MPISKVYDENEADKLGFNADEEDEEEPINYESWVEKYGIRKEKE